jgi:hypothetical protein
LRKQAIIFFFLSAAVKVAGTHFLCIESWVFSNDSITKAFYLAARRAASEDTAVT